MSPTSTNPACSLRAPSLCRTITHVPYAHTIVHVPCDATNPNFSNAAALLSAFSSTTRAQIAAALFARRSMPCAHRRPLLQSSDGGAYLRGVAMSPKSRGIPFFHCGDEILRSKSLDRDSYNSGDWFNRLDFTYQANNWGVGLPPREKNEYNWPLIQPRLANPSFKPEKHHILAAVDNFVDLLKIRYSSPLFRLRTANAIQVQLFTTDITYLSGVRSYTNVYGERLHFHNTGPSWVQGIIIMSIEDGDAEKPGMAQIDPVYSLVVVLFNVCPAQVSLEIPALKSRTLQLHPVQLNSVDDVVKQSAYDASSGGFIIPRKTTSVFVELRNT
ncbi:hypothetical protein ZIOFF_040052 [Zingiber officinale]|uniref:Alpha-1,6-glucosidases pullulanase-type C-terminal domain-containing protein n=1 Tax=Zingiber officinale TaxID=94328 RepID=A0A8J5G2A5_ZINOF|nr:hypothetical protein ZIOFF_040052 [Zingiber officinale]